MSTQTNEILNAENTTQEPRDINTLLNLETYQGMSDAEIDLVVSYKVDKEVTSREFTAKLAATVELEEQIIADNKASAKAARDVVQSVIDRGFPISQVVTPMTVTPISVEV